MHSTYGLSPEAAAPQSASSSMSGQAPSPARAPQPLAVAALGAYLPQLRAALGSILHTCHLMFGQSLLIASKTSQGERLAHRCSPH